MRKNIVLNLRFGFGNQLFEYACAYALAKKYNRKLIIDLSYYQEKGHPAHEICLLQKLTIEPCKFVVSDSGYNARNFVTKKMKGIRRAITCGMPPTKVVCIENPQEIVEIKPDVDKHLRILGWFQSWKYFIGFEEDIRRQFKPNFEFSVEGKEWINRVIGDENSVSVHIRRGDYLTHFGATITSDYYNQAMEYILAKNSNAKFYFFSDDITWVKNIYKGDNVTYVSETKLDALEEFYVMAACRHNIIVNSSFSWWAAWLNGHNNKIVIAPMLKYKDADWSDGFYPDEWITIPAEMR